MLSLVIRRCIHNFLCLISLVMLVGATDVVFAEGSHIKPVLPPPSPSQIQRAMAYGERFQAQMPQRQSPYTGYPYDISPEYVRPSPGRSFSGPLYPRYYNYSPWTQHRFHPGSYAWWGPYHRPWWQPRPW